MLQAIEAEISPDGTVTLLEPVHLARRCAGGGDHLVAHRRNSPEAWVSRGAARRPRQR